MLILASQSPRRRELLGRLGLPFTAVSADIDETMTPGIDPVLEVARLSREKAQAVDAGPRDVVLAADTVVILDGEVLGKPHTPEKAKEMLRRLSGRAHLVVTGYTVLKDGKAITETEESRIFFRELLPREIDAYVESGEPLDKAGAYGIQGLGALFIRGLEGDYYNVMGLPLCAVSQTLRSLGLPILGV